MKIDNRLKTFFQLLLFLVSTISLSNQKTNNLMSRSKTVSKQGNICCGYLINSDYISIMEFVFVAEENCKSRNVYGLSPRSQSISITDEDTCKAQNSILISTIYDLKLSNKSEYKDVVENLPSNIIKKYRDEIFAKSLKEEAKKAESAEICCYYHLDKKRKVHKWINAKSCKAKQGNVRSKYTNKKQCESRDQKK